MAKFKISVSEHRRSEREVEALGSVMEFANHTPEEFRSVTEEDAPLLPLAEDPRQDSSEEQ